MAMTAALVLGTVSASGCLVTDNPDFGHGNNVETTGAEPSTTEAGDCDPGEPNGLDCDGDGLCESDRRDVDTCGTCGRSCRLLDQEGECDSMGNSFQCRGVFEMPALEDAYVREDQPDQNTNGDLRLIVSATPRTHAFIGGPEVELIPDFVSIEEANLCLTSLDGGDQVLGHTVVDMWSADMIDWTTQPPSDAMASLVIDPVAGRGCVDVLELLEVWRGGSPNYGVVLVPGPMGAVEYLATESGAGPVYELRLYW